MKKLLLFLRYLALLGLITITPNFTCIKQESFRNPNIYYDFQVSVERIKQKLNVNDNLTTVYFQKFYQADSLIDNFSIPLFTGEFLSSQSKLYFSSPTFALKEFYLPSTELCPEKILFTLETKVSDTIYYYMDYTCRTSGWQISTPMACILPDGKIVPLHGQNRYASYAEERIKDIIDEIALNY